MAAPFDLTKLKKAYNKTHNVKEGFDDPITWIDTGNYALNKMISGDFYKGVPLSAVTMVAGESGSGKSYLVSANIIKNALAQGIYVFLIDTEDALKESWMTDLGVDVNHPNLSKYVLSTVNEIASFINEMTEQYRKDYLEVPREEQPKILFVIDSLGVVETEAEIEQFSKGELKGDKGIKAKMLKMLIGNCIRLFAGFEIGLVATNHIYKSQDMYSPDDIISGGSGFVYASSIVVAMNKKKLKGISDKEQGKKKVIGITAVVKCVKTRFSKPFEEVEIEIPYETGMDPYSGLMDMFKAKGLIVPKGAYIVYTSKKTGEVIQCYAKDFDHDKLNMVMDEWSDHENNDEKNIDKDTSNDAKPLSENMMENE